MRLDSKIVKKINNGDGLTNNELETALEFYREMAEGLDSLGPEFKLALKEVHWTMRTLESFQFFRERGI